MRSGVTRLIEPSTSSAPEDVPRVADVESGHLGQVVVVGECVGHDVPPCVNDRRLAAAKAWTGHMSWSSPHAVGAVDVPAHEAVDVDERVAVDDHPADRLADRPQPATLGVGGLELDPFDPALRRVAHCPTPAVGEGDGATVATQEPVGDGVVVAVAASRRW